MMARWRQARQRYQALVERYGSIAIGTYLAIFFGVLLLFWVALGAGMDLGAGFQRLGIDTASATSRSGTLVVAWGFTKLTQPLRIAATIALTPLFARLRRKG